MIHFDFILSLEESDTILDLINDHRLKCFENSIDDSLPLAERSWWKKRFEYLKVVQEKIKYQSLGP